MLGRLNPAYFLGGEIGLSVELARDAIRRDVAQPLGLAVERAAFGIVKIADTYMAQAVRQMTVQRGHDPRDFAIFAYGGGGPGHAVALARELGIGTVVVPPHPGIFSAVGMLLSDAKESYKLSRLLRLADTSAATFEQLFAEMEADGSVRMRRSGFADDEIGCVRSVEMRYTGQEFTLSLPFGAELESRFATLHELRYGHAFASTPTEVVALQVEVYGRLPKPTIALAPATGAAAEAASRDVYFEDEGFVRTQVVRRSALALGERLDGPSVIEEEASTTVIHPGDSVTVDAASNLVVTVATIGALERAASRWAASMT